MQVLLEILCVCVHAQLCLTLCNPVDCSLPGSSIHEIFQAKYWCGLPFPSLRYLPDPGIEPMSLAYPLPLQVNSLLLSTWESLEILSALCREHSCHHSPSYHPRSLFHLISGLSLRDFGIFSEFFPIM